MKKIFLNWIKRVFFTRRNQIFSKDVLLGRGELAEISASAFVHAELTKSLHKDMVILIVSNNFVAEPGLILSHFNSNYNFTIDEFVVLSYKIGMVTKTYMENPISLLNEAIKLTDVFAEETIIQLKQLLNKQEAFIQNDFNQKFQIRLAEEKELKTRLKPISIDAEANAKIDEWLKKNKKN